MAIAPTGPIDADGHVRDDDRRVRQFIAPPFDKRSPLGISANDGFDRHLGGTLGLFDVDAPTWQQALDEGGLAAAVLFPTVGLRNGHIREPDFAIARCRAYNDWLHSEFLSVDERFKGVALLPVQDPSAAAEELRRAVRDLGGIVAGMLPEGPYVYGDLRFDPIYAEAERLGCPITIHEGGNVWDSIYHHLFPQFAEVHTLGHPFAQMRHLTSILCEGVLVRFPKLKMGFLEAGCTWVPFLLDRMDERFRLRGEREMSALTKPPSDYVRDGKVYFTCEADETLLAETLRVIGDGAVMYATDFPHWDGEYPESLHTLMGRADLTEEQRARITSRNAREFYAL